MARRDVDLRVRAKADDAEKALESVTAALNEFRAAQKGIVAQGNDTKSSFSDLGASIVQLDKAMKSFDDRFSGKVEKAAEKSAALSSVVEKTSAALIESERAFAQAEKAATKAADALGKTTAKFEAARKAQRADTEALKKATAARDEAAGRQQRYADAIAKSSDTIKKSAAKVAEYTKRVKELQEALKQKPGNINIGKGLVSAERQLVKFNTANRDAKAELRAAQAGYDRATVSVQKYGENVAKADRALKDSDKAVKRVATSLNDVKVRAKETASAQNQLAGDIERTTARLARETAELGRTEAALQGVSGELSQARAQFEAFSKQGFQGLRLDIGQQVRAVREAREVFAQLNDAAARLAQQIGAVGVPTLEMAFNFERVKQQAREAKDELIQQTNTLGALRQAFNAAGGEASKLTATQERFAKAHADSDVALRKVAQGAGVARQELNGLFGAYAKLQGTRIVSNVQPLQQEATLLQRLKGLWAAVNGEKRTSLGLTQRLRGEVLSMVAAYGGLFAVVDVLTRTVNAFQQLEGAQSRLNVAVGGDTQKSAQELDFVRRTAERLGVEFGYLATEYSKFAIATQGTNLAGENTRKIFTSVAEAARVNRATNEELKGVFTALTQIVSKGAVQMEELRQQLGDRLPGALQLMADGLGITTAELIKMTEQGQITSDALLPFAEELDKRFGPGLAGALESVTTAIGRMQNAAFQALLVFGKGGFLDAFENLANTITEVLGSADFETFIGNLSGVFAVLTDVVSAAIANFQLLFTAISAIVAVKILPWVLVLGGAFKKAALDGIAGFSLAMGAAGQAAATAGGRMAGASAGVLAFSGALKTLLATTGVGLVFVAATSALAYWATEADAATEALERHQDILDKVRNAYDVAGTSVEKWREALDGLTVTETEKALGDVEESLDDAISALDRYIRKNSQPIFGFGPVEEYRDEINGLIADYKNGSLSADDLLKAVDKTNQKFDEGSEYNRRYGERIIEFLQSVVTFDNASEDLRDTLTAQEGATDEAAAAIARLNGETEKASVSQEEFSESMDKLGAAVAAVVEFAPKAKKGQDELSLAADTMRVAYDEALAAARALPDAIMRAAAEQRAFNGLAEGMKAVFEANQALIDNGFGGGLVDRIIGVESGGNASARNPNSTATGAGQFIEATWLRMFKDYFPDRARGLTDAMILALREDAELSRKMVELYLRENAEQLQRAGVAITDANLYLAHFLGPGGATSLINSAPGTIANDVLSQGAINSNASILDGKTREEVIAWAQRKVGISKEELGVQERIIEIENERLESVIEQADKAIERVEKEKAQTDERIADGQFEISQQELINAGKERQAAIEEAIREAKAENKNISEAELAIIAEQAGKTFDLANANKDLLTTKERAQQAEEEVNNLLSIRQSLMDQMRLAAEEGDTATQETIRLKIEEINTTLVSAIENAIKFWQAVGGTEADAAIAKLQTMNIEAAQFDTRAEGAFFSWKKVGELLTGGLSNAFNTFAQRLAETGNVFQSLREAFLQFASDFLIQIGQMIIQMAIFNALKGTGLGNFLGIGVAHKGDVVGRSSGRNQRRRVSPAIFAGAQRFHGGGLPGLKPGEVPIIAQKGEEVLSKSDPRNIMNGGGVQSSGTPDVNVTTINLFDPVAALEAALNSPAGGKLMVNHVAANSGKFRGALGT